MPEGTKTTVKKAEKKNKGLIIGIIVAIVAVIALVVGIILINVNKDTVVGSYVLTGVIDKDGKEDTQALGLMKAFGVNITLEIQEGGTGYMETYGEKTEFTWDEKNIKSKDDEGKEQSLNYTYKDGKITLEHEGEKMVFTKKELVKEDDSNTQSVDLNGMFNSEEGETETDTDTGIDDGSTEE